MLHIIRAKWSAKRKKRKRFGRLSIFTIFAVNIVMDGGVLVMLRQKDKIGFVRGVGKKINIKSTMVPNIQYDHIADEYVKFEENNPRKHILIGRKFVETIGDLDGKSVLDLGCGLGFFAVLAKKQKANYVLGVDISEKIIELAKTKANASGFDIDYRVCAIADFRIDRKFDIATAGFVFNYANNKTELNKSILSASRHLEPGGKLFAILCNPDNPVRDKKILYRVRPVISGELGDGAKLRCEFYDKKGDFLCSDYKFLWSKNTVENMLEDLDFHKIEWMDIQNERTGKSIIPKLQSTNVILYAVKK